MFVNLIIYSLFINIILCNSIYIKYCNKKDIKEINSGWFSSGNINGNYMTRYDSFDTDYIPCTNEMCISNDDIFEWQINDPELTNVNNYICKIKYSKNIINCNINDIRIKKIKSNKDNCYIYNYVF